MNVFFNWRVKRAVTWLSLTVWLFALSAGMANACLLQVQAAHGHLSNAEARGDTRSTATAGHRAVADAAVHDDLGTLDPPCLKVCDETPQSLIKTATGADVDSPLQAVLVAAPWSWLPSLDDGGDARPPLPAYAPPPGPPPRVRFSRLAL